MPPKGESAAAKKAREKLERFAAIQFQERLDYELEEERARSNAELVERVGRAELMNHFYELMMQPSSRLMIAHTTFEKLRMSMQNEGALSAQRLLEMQVELRRAEKGSEALTHELVHLRGEVRSLLSQAAASLAAVQLKVEASAARFFADLKASASVHGDPLQATGPRAAELEVVLDEVRRQHANIAMKAQFKASEMTTIWQEQTSMHTRIPPRIRRTLQNLDKDALLLILDTLSFEDVVHKYLLFRYSPGVDDPMMGGLALLTQPAPPDLTARP